MMWSDRTSKKRHPKFMANFKECKGICRGQELNIELFSQNFRASLGYPSKSPGCPTAKFVSLGFKRHTELLGPDPFAWKTDPPPHRKISGPESLSLCSFFLSELWKAKRQVLTKGSFMQAKIASEKAHKRLTHELFLQPFNPGLIPGTNPFCPWDMTNPWFHSAKSGANLGFLSGVVPKATRPES